MELTLADRPGWADLRLARAAGGAVVVAALAAGVMADIAVRSGVALGGAVLVAAVAAMLLRTGRPLAWQPWILIGAAPVFGAFLAVRTSPWLLPLDVLAAFGLLVLGASLARGGSFLDLSLLGLLGRGLHAGLHGLAAPAFAGQGLSRLRSRFGGASTWRWGATFRGVVLALPLLLVLGALLASADVLFAHLFDFAPDVGGLGAHVAVVTLGAWGMAGLLRLAAATPLKPVPQRFALVGPVEATVVLGSLVALFATFAVTQVVGLAGGGRHVVETAGLTYAEYARSGFFQLVAVAAITFAVLLAVDVLTEPSDQATRRRLLLLGEACVGLTLVVVLSALHRLNLYENAYGLTMLRLYAGVLVAWVGVCLALLGGWLAGHRRRGWFPAAAIGMGLAGLLVLNLTNPEALVVRHNVALAERSGRFDPGYLLALSEDAVPDLVRSLPRLDATAQAEVRAHICSGPATPSRGWAAWNHAQRAATVARRQVCR